MPKQSTSGQIIASDCVIVNLKATSKKQVLQDLADIAGRALDEDPANLFEKLMAREKLGSTGIGRGVAIPHAKLDETEGVSGFFARLDQPVDFDAVDDQPVDLVFLLLAPVNSSGLHLKALARISRLLRNEDLCKSLRSSNACNVIADILNKAQDSEAA